MRTLKQYPWHHFLQILQFQRLIITFTAATQTWKWVNEMIWWKVDDKQTVISTKSLISLRHAICWQYFPHNKYLNWSDAIGIYGFFLLEEKLKPFPVKQKVSESSSNDFLKVSRTKYANCSQIGQNANLRWEWEKSQKTPPTTTRYRRSKTYLEVSIEINNLQNKTALVFCEHKILKL